MSLKKNTLILCMLLIATASFSQAFIKKLKTTPASEIALKSTELMNQKLDLSVEQNDLIYSIYEENWIVKKEILANSSFFSIRGKMKDQNKIQNSAFREVLTEKQYLLYEERVFKEIKSSMKTWLENN
ncbi:MAG: hypothetical protein KUG68_00430 [Flavobacteriaceae bacterium]|nr:hypothetical protein [Flavobacteriaceae bacterium]